MVIVFGIKNCDSVKKACHWLNNHNIDYQFHDFRKDGLNQAKVKSWMKQVEWQSLLNKRSTTWRKLPDQDKDNINNTNVVKLMTVQPALIKRPVIEVNDKIIVGFSEKIYKDSF
ncbi:MAG: ArsC family reductase [Pseudomonadota bacterium]